MNTTIKSELSLRQFSREAILYNTTLSALIFGTMRLNPEIWVHDYPPDIQEKYGPISEQAKRQGRIVAVPFLLVLFGGIVWSNLKLKRRNGGKLSLAAAYANAFGLIFSGWFFDLTILDWLIFVRMTPDFVVLPGTEGMAGYDDYIFHLREHMHALPMLAGLAGVIALLTASRPWRSQGRAQ